MNIQLQRGIPNPHLIHFEKNNMTGFTEAGVAANAMSFTPYEQEWLGMSDDTALEFATMGATIVNFAKDTGEARFNMDLEGLRKLGMTLRYYRDRTATVLPTLSMPGASPMGVTIRRIEGAMAGTMFDTIAARRIKIPILKSPGRRYPIGFSR